MSDNYSNEEHNKRKKGSLQHKIFKVVILVIVAVFLYLIVSFLKIEFFKRNNVDYKFELNAEKSNYLDKRDKYFPYSNDNINIDECDLWSFLKYLNLINYFWSMDKKIKKHLQF